MAKEAVDIAKLRKDADMARGLTKSAAVQGMHLVGRDAAKLGVVRELFVDLESGDIAFIIVEASGLLGGAGKFHPVPWAVARYDSVAGAFQMDRSKEEFKASPSYDRVQLADTNYGWAQQSSRYFTPGLAEVSP